MEEGAVPEDGCTSREQRAWHGQGFPARAKWTSAGAPAWQRGKAARAAASTKRAKIVLIRKGFRRTRGKKKKKRPRYYVGRAHVCVRAACPLHFPISRALPTRCQYRSASLHLHTEKAEGRQRNIYVCSALSLRFILNRRYTIRTGPPVVSKGIPTGNIAIKPLGAAGRRAAGCRRLRVVPAVPGHFEPQTAWHGRSLPAPVQLESNRVACCYLLLEEYLIVKSWGLSENGKQVWDLFFFNPPGNRHR